MLRKSDSSKRVGTYTRCLEDVCLLDPLRSSSRRSELMLLLIREGWWHRTEVRNALPFQSRPLHSSFSSRVFRVVLSALKWSTSRQVFALEECEEARKRSKHADISDTYERRSRGSSILADRIVAIRPSIPIERGIRHLVFVPDFRIHELRTAGSRGTQR